MLKKKISILLIFLMVASFTFNMATVQAHAPNYVDIKYYVEEEVLSIYITHGVSNETYHFVEKVIVEFYDLPQSFLDEFNGTEFVGDDREHYEDGTLKSDRIQEEDVWSIEHLLTPSPLPTLIFNYTEQETHQIFHYNYSIFIPEWTYVVVTAICHLGGERSQSIISGHPWYDIEHSMLEALVPTIICSVVVMTPLALWRIFGKKPKEEVKH